MSLIRPLSMANRPLFSDQHLSLSLSLFRSQRSRSREKNRKDDNSFLLTAEGGNRRLNAAHPCSLALCPFENCAGEVGEGDQCHAWVYRPILYQFSRLLKLRKINWGTLKRFDLGCVIPRPGCLAKGASKPNVQQTMYREVNKGLYVVAGNFFLLLLNCSAWLCLGPA